MGLDVNLYATGVVTDDELEQAVEFFRVRELRGTPIRDRWEANRIDVDMGGSRYYGPHYERGPWPEIALNIMATVAAFPSCTVHYGSDSTVDAPIVDDDLLTEMWRHYFSPRWNDYLTERSTT